MTDKSDSTMGLDKASVKTSLESHTFFLGGIFFIILFVALYFARQIILPLVFAILFNFLLTPAVKFLRKMYIPIHIGAALVILLVLFIISGGFYVFSKPAISWANKGPQVLNKVDQKVTDLANLLATPVQVISKIKEEISSFTNKAKIKSNNIVAETEFPILGSVFTSTWQFLLELCITVILLYFLLISKHFFLRKIVNWLSSLNKKKEAIIIAHEIENQIWKYLFARTAINVGLAIVVSILMYLLGMPDPILWGVMAGLLEFIPYVGALISTIVVALIALLSFNSLGYCFLIVFLFFVVLAIEGNIVFPIVIGRTLTLTPIVILLSLLFWGWIWGVAGAFIAIPLMVTIKIIFENLYEASLIGELLSD